MVERLISRLRLTQEEAVQYRPTPGIDIIWLEWEKPDVVVAEFVGSDLQPDPRLRITAAEMRDSIHKTLRGRILDDNLTTHQLSPRRALKIETFLEHPEVSKTSSGATPAIKKAADAATEVHDIELTKDQFDNIKRAEDGTPITPREIRRKTRPLYEKAQDGRMIMRQDAGKTDEYYVMSYGVIDIG